MILDKLSKEAKQELIKILNSKNDIIRHEIEEFVSVADKLDEKGFYKAADIINSFIKQISKKVHDSGRMHAYILRRIRRQ
jgi:hypothetical protein